MGGGTDGAVAVGTSKNPHIPPLKLQGVGGIGKQLDDLMRVYDGKDSSQGKVKGR